MQAALKARFGHEENFSRYLLESGQFAQLLARAGFTLAGEGALEVSVAKGHEGHEGRLDIYQPTTAGVVIGEMQYGTSDSNHRNRFEGYAKSVASPAAIVWVAERFREKDLDAVAQSKVPVVCVQAKETACNNIVLTAVGGARLSAQSLEKRVAKANEQAWQWVKAVNWTEAARDEFNYGHGWGAESLERLLLRTDEQWLRALLEDYAVLGKTRPSAARRCKQVRSCSYWPEIKAYILPLVAAARAECEAMAVACKEEEAKSELQYMAELQTKKQAAEELEAEWEQEKADQAEDPSLEEIKQCALDVYCEYMDDSSLHSAVREMYLFAEAACVAAGYKWLTGLPFVCTFIPERYSCGRPLA